MTRRSAAGSGPSSRLQWRCTKLATRSRRGGSPNAASCGQPLGDRGKGGPPLGQVTQHLPPARDRREPARVGEQRPQDGLAPAVLWSRRPPVGHPPAAPFQPPARVEPERVQQVVDADHGKPNPVQPQAPTQAAEQASHTAAVGHEQLLGGGHPLRPAVALHLPLIGVDGEPVAASGGDQPTRPLGQPGQQPPGQSPGSPGTAAADAGPGRRSAGRTIPRPARPRPAASASSRTGPASSSSSSSRGP